VVELAPAVRTMLTALFHAHDVDNDGALSATELQQLLSTAPYSPWDAPQWKVSFLGDAKSSLGDAKSSLGDAASLAG
jgi:hypothetical protein